MKRIFLKKTLALLVATAISLQGVMPVAFAQEAIDSSVGMAEFVEEEGTSVEIFDANTEEQGEVAELSPNETLVGEDLTEDDETLAAEEKEEEEQVAAEEEEEQVAAVAEVPSDDEIATVADAITGLITEVVTTDTKITFTIEDPDVAGFTPAQYSYYVNISNSGSSTSTNTTTVDWVGSSAIDITDDIISGGKDYTLYVSIWDRDKETTYTESVDVTTKTSIADGIVNFSQSEYTFDGTSHTPSVVSIMVNGTNALSSYSTAQYEWSDTQDAGTATCKITLTAKEDADEGYFGTVSANYNINERDISYATIGDIEKQAFTGSEIKPDITVTDYVMISDTDGNEISTNIIAETDYEVTYSNNTIAGTATATITPTATGNYKDDTGKGITKEFTIVQSDATFENDATPAIKTYSAADAEETQTSEFNYGDTINVDVIVSATGAESVLAVSNAISDQTKNTVAIYDEDEKLLSAVEEVTEGTTTTLSIDTMNLELGANELTLQYSGNDNMADVSDTFTVTISVAELPNNIELTDVFTDYGEWQKGLTATLETKSGYTVCDTYDGTYGTTISFDETSSGTYDQEKVYIKTTDDAYYQATVTYKLENTAPTITVTNPTGSGTSLDFTVTAKSDYSDIESLVVTKSDETFAISADDKLTITESGTYTVTATTEAGNTKTEEITVYAVTFSGITSPQLVVTGGMVTSQTAETKSGYTFDQWEKDTGTAFDFEKTEITSNIALTAVYTLDAPTVEITGTTSTTYGTTVTLTAGASHLNSGLKYTYQWYEVDGTDEILEGETSSTLELTGVSDSGTYKVVVTATDEDGLTATANDSAEVVISKATSTLTLSDISGITYESTTDLSATVAGINSEIPTGKVQFKDNGTAIGGAITVDSTTGVATCQYKPTSAGDHSITAEFTSTNGNYSDSTAAAKTLSVDKAEQVTLSITTSGATYAVDGTFTLETSGGSGTGAVSYTIVDGSSDVITISGNTATIVGAGTETITATKAADNNYNSITTVNTAITIAKAAAPTITYPTVSTSATYGETLADVTLIGGSTGYGSFAWTTGTTLLSVGTSGYSATFTPSADTTKNYETVSNLTADVNVTTDQAAPSIAAEVVSITGNTGSRVTELKATMTGVGSGITPTGTVTFKDGTTTIATVNLTEGVATTSYTKDDEYTVTAEYSGDTNYTSVTSTSVAVNTAKQTQTITLTEIGAKTYGDATFELTSSGASGTGDVTYESSNTAAISIDGTTATIVGAGEATITVKVAEDATYNQATDTKVVTVSQKALTLTADDKTIIRGQDIPPLTYIATGLVTGDKLTTAPTLTCATGDKMISGEYTITISGAFDANYSITHTNGKLTVSEGYTVTFVENSGSDVVDLTDVAHGATIAEPTTTRSGYTFLGWYAEEACTTAWDFAEGAVTDNITLYASWKKKSSSNSNYSEGVSSGTSISGDTVTTEIDVTVSNKAATVSVTENMIETALGAKGDNSDSDIVLDITMNKTDVEKLSVTLPEDGISALVEAEVERLTIMSNLCSVSFDLEALERLEDKYSGDITLVISPLEDVDMDDDVEEMVGNRPIYEITLLDEDGDAITYFADGTLLISIPYEKSSSEKAEYLTVYYIDDDGDAEWMEDSKYVSSSKEMQFTTNHLSVYAVAYNKNLGEELEDVEAVEEVEEIDLTEIAYTDIFGHWGEDVIVYAVENDWFDGTSEDEFSPNLPATRGAFITALGRIYGADVSGYTESRFVDVDNEAYYMPYIEWAKDEGVASGTSEDTFAPDDEISREQMAVMLMNYIGFAEMEFSATVEQTTFLDDGEISSWAAESVARIQMLGIISGRDGNIFDPKGTATRAEACSMLVRMAGIA